MASKTTNFNLHKIELTDAPPDITVLNQNWDTIDTQLKQAQDDAATASEDASTALLTAERIEESLGESGSGKRVTRLTVGTSTAGWTTKDCDYLCDGEEDDVEINEAIAALPSSGGEVVLLDGTYYINDTITLNKMDSTLRGNGTSTYLLRMFDGGYLINATGYRCIVSDLYVDGASADGYSDTSNDEVCIKNDYSIVRDVTVCNSGGIGIWLDGDHCKVYGSTTEYCLYGISIDGSMCTVTGNTCNCNLEYGINLCGTHNVVTGNVARLNEVANMRIFYGRQCTVVGNDFSVYNEDGGTTDSIYTSAANNTNNIVTNNNVGIGTVSVQGSNNVVGNPSYTYGTSDITAGSSSLTTGALYLVYE